MPWAERAGSSRWFSTRPGGPRESGLLSPPRWALPLCRLLWAVPLRAWARRAEGSPGQARRGEARRAQAWSSAELGWMQFYLFLSPLEDALIGARGIQAYLRRLGQPARATFQIARAREPSCITNFRVACAAPKFIWILEPPKNLVCPQIYLGFPKFRQGAFLPTRGPCWS